MKKLLSLGILCASVIAAPLVAHAATINGSEGVNLTFPTTGATSLVGATSITWVSSVTTSGTNDYSGIQAGTPLSGSTTIFTGAGHLGGVDSAHPFTFTIGNLGTFVATTDVEQYVAGPQGQNGSGAFFTISGFFTPAGALGGFSETSADVVFALTQSGATETGTFSLTSPSNFDPPPPPPSVPEPSSLALLGTGIMTGVGFLRRRKA